MPERFGEYLRTVGEQIRWKRVRTPLLTELRTHLLEQMDDYLSSGMNEDAAQAETLRQMGDPVVVGTELDRVHRPKPQWGLLALTLAFALVGGFLRVWLTAGWGESIHPMRVATALLCGTVGLLAGYFLDYTFLGRHAKGVYVLALIVALLVLHVSPMRNNSYVFTRYVVLFYPLVYAVWLYGQRKKGWKGLLAAVVGMLPLVAIGLLTPFLLGVTVLLVSGYILLLWAAWRDHFGTGRKSVLAVVLALAGSISAWVCYMLTKGYNTDRIQILLHPEQDPLGTGYQAMTVRTALQAARWLGKGEWTGYAGYTEPFERTVPAWSSDFLLTTMIYKLGWLPFLLLVLAFGALVLWLLVKCLRQTNQLGRLVSAAVALTLGLHGAFSIMLNLGFVLFGGIFPLVIGNLLSVPYMIMIGLALSVFRQERIPADVTVPLPNVPHRPLISWQNGDLIIALGERD